MGRRRGEPRVMDGPRQRFAKVFDSPDLGQIVVIRQSDDRGEPELRLYFEPEGFGVCQSAFGFHDTPEGWARLDEAFEGLHLAQAADIVTRFLEHAGGLSEKT